MWKRMWARVNGWFRRPRAGKTVALPSPALTPKWEVLDAELVKDIQELATEEIVALFTRAKFDEVGVQVQDVLAELFDRALRGDPAAVFVGRVDGRPVALSIMLPPNRLTPLLLCYHFYNEGPTELRDAMLQEMVAWARRLGYDEAMAFALRDGPAWEKTFAIAHPSVWGSVYKFDLKGAEDGINRWRGREQVD